MFPVFWMLEKDGFCDTEGHLAFDMDAAIRMTALRLARLRQWGVEVLYCWAGTADGEVVMDLRHAQCPN